MQIKIQGRVMKKIFGLLLLSLPLFTWAEAGVRFLGAQPNYSTGQYEESNIDLSVKVLGGYVRVQRNFNAKKWSFNRGAKTMEFNYGREHDSLPNEINVSGIKYKLDTQSINESAGQDDAQAVYFSESDSDLGINLSRIEKYDDSFKWLDNDGNWIDYNAEGQVSQGGNRNTVTTKTVLDVQGRIFQVLDAKNSLVLTYDYTAPDSDKIKQITDYSGRSVSYQYDESDRLVRVVDALGHTWHYEYSISDELIRVKNPAGHTRHIFYVQGNVTAIKDDAGIGVNFAYDYNALSKQYYFRETQSSGSVKESRYNSDGLLIEQKVDNLLTRKVVEVRQGIYKVRTLTDVTGNRIQQTLDQRGNIIKVERRDGSIQTASYDGPYQKISQHTNSLGIITQLLYGPKGNIQSITQAAGTPVQRITYYEHDDYGQLIKVTYPADEFTPQAIYQFTYDDKGNRLTQTNPLTHKVAFENNVQGDVTLITDAKGKKWQREYDAVGNLLSVKDPLNRIYQAKYNQVGERVQVTAPNGRITNAQYDHKGRVIAVSWPQNSDATQRMIYNDMERSVTQQDALGFTHSQSFNSLGQVNKTLDANGNQTLYHYNGLLLNKVDFPSFAKHLLYDQRNRIKQQKLTWTQQNQNQQQSHNVVYNSEDQAISYRDALNKQTQSQYDELGRLIKRTGAINDETLFVYDSRNNLVALTDAEGRVTRFSYNVNNQKISETREPEVGVLQVRTYEYDANGNLILETKPAGERLEHEYDDANQKIASRYFRQNKVTSEPELQKTIFYQYNVLGQLTMLDDGITRQSYQYNILGQLIQTEVNYGVFSKVLAYSYDKRGKKSRYTNPENITYQYAYNGNGNILNVQLPSTGQISFLGYQANRPTQIVFPGGLKTLYNYDGINREFSKEVLDSAGNNQSQSVYSYDGQNNITGITTEHGTYQYNYDDLYRLTQAHNPAEAAELTDETYSYDLVHNRLSSQLFNNWQYNDANQLTAYGDITRGTQAYEFEYNANGQLIRKTHLQKTIELNQPDVINRYHTHYQYDASERLISIEKQTDEQAKTSVASYQYNALGQRISKTVNSETTHYLYDQTGLLAQYNAAGELLQEYHYTPGSPFMTRPLFTRAKRLNDSEADLELYFYQNSHLGTPQKIFAKNSELVWSALYESFGQGFVQTELIKNNLRFPGQYFDAETNNHYNYFRDYDPSLGRYIQGDPIGLIGGVNFYSYVSSSPLNRIDIYGLADIAFNIEIDLTTLVGYELALGIVWDTDDQLDSGVFFSGGGSTGANLGVGLGFIYTPGDIEGWSQGTDVNIPSPILLGGSIQSGVTGGDTYIGGSLGIGYGVSYNKSYTTTFSFRDLIDCIIR